MPRPTPAKTAHPPRSVPPPLRPYPSRATALADRTVPAHFEPAPDDTSPFDLPFPDSPFFEEKELEFIAAEAPATRPLRRAPEWAAAPDPSAAASRRSVEPGTGSRRAEREERRRRTLRSKRRRITLLTALSLGALVALGLVFGGYVRPGLLTVSSHSSHGSARPSVGATAIGFELGEKFTAGATGAVTGVTYYALDKGSGRHFASVWSASGQLLGRTAMSTRAKGWQTVTLAKPVQVAKGTQYVVSFWSEGYQPSNSAWPKHTSHGTTMVSAAPVYRAGPGFPDTAGPYRDNPLSVALTPGSTPSATASTPASSPSSSTSPSSSVPSSSSSSPSSSSAVVPVGGCVGNPSGCGYPDASTTGVPAGTALRSVPGQVSSGPGWSFSGGTLSVTGTGAVLQGLAVNGSIDVSASNVVISKVRVVQTGESWGIGLRHTKNVTIQDSEISSPAASGGDRLLVGIKDVYGDASGTKVLRTDVWHASTGVQIHAGLIQDSYIHDPGYASGDHLNGITSNGSFGETLTIEHNTVLNSYGQTDAISLFEDFSVQANRVIDNNLVAGGGYTIYGGANPGGKATSNIKITNNRFSRMYFPDGGSYGPYTAYASGSGNTWSGNVWDDTGKAVN